MSGHSKWAQIKRQKGVADQKRGQAFTKIANAITIAVKDSGGIVDPEQNFKLRLLVEKARSSNMPKENIERAIERGSGKGGKGEEFFEAVYEGFAPGGVAVMVEAATDNKMRTYSEVKNVFDKNGGSMGSTGSVAYQFAQKGCITVVKNANLFDDIFLSAVECGAEDVEDAGETVLVFTSPEQLFDVKSALSGQYVIESAELIRKPVVTVTIEDKVTCDKVIAFIEKLEAMDDVQKVYANFEVSDTLLSE